MTKEEHIEHHKRLHRAFDELLADFIEHHPERSGFMKMPVAELLVWSAAQTVDPSEETKR